MKAKRDEKLDIGGLKGLAAGIARLRSSDEVFRLFEDLCTPAELQAMVDRWQAVPLIKAGLSYREIHARTGVSVTTIGRVARTMEYGSGGYEIMLKRTGLYTTST